MGTSKKRRGCLVGVLCVACLFIGWRLSFYFSDDRMDYIVEEVDLPEDDFYLDLSEDENSDSIALMEEEELDLIRYVDEEWDDDDLIAYEEDDDEETTFQNREVPVKSTVVSSKEIKYLDILQKFKNYDHITSKFGKIIDSNKRSKDNGWSYYTYYYDTGWEEQVSVGPCNQCHGNPECKLPHYPFSVCFFCGNTGKCKECKGSGESLIFTASHKESGWAYMGGSRYNFKTGAGMPGGTIHKGGGINKGDNDDSGNSFQRSRCPICRGTGNCTSCHGKGHIYNVYGGYETDCPSCHGDGECFNCYGTGKI